MERDATGKLIDFSAKDGGVHSEIAIPNDAPEWVRQDLGFSREGVVRLDGAAAIEASQTLWNRVEAGEKRVDATYAIDLIVALPRELSEAENIELVRAFVEENYTAKGRIADWAYHRPEDKQHNPHVHIMTTLRPLTDTGFGPKTLLLKDEQNEPVRSKRGDLIYDKWAGSKSELLENREAWANHVNMALARAGHEIAVDHRSFKDRGITEIEPTTHRGLVHHLGGARAHDEHVRADLEARSRNFAAFEANPSLVLEHITRQQSTFDLRDVARMIHRYAGEGDDFQSLLHRVGTLPELVTIQAQIHDPESNRIVQRERFTTVGILEREASMLDAVERRAADHSFAVDAARKEEAVARAQVLQGFDYTPEQRAAVDRLTRDDGVSAMVGIAGAGKSTVLRAVNEVYRAESVGVYGAALAGKAADNLEASSGIVSRTLASWEFAWDIGRDQLQKGDVFVIDEAGMVASAQMARVVDQLDRFGAKVVLVGDSRQLQPIEAGAAFRSIANEVGYVELTEVRRQERSDHAHASVLFGAGQARSALDIYEGNDTFRVHDARDDALQAAIKGWHHDWRANVDVLMLAHTNRDVTDLNAMARSVIQAESGLQDGRQILTSRGMREFAIGDRVLFFDNDRELGVRNGTVGFVERFDSGTMYIALPERAEPIAISPGGYNEIDHGYATTIHKSQGSTVDRVHIVASGMMDAQLTYVALSRHREEVTMHVPLDAFTHSNAEKLATKEYAMDRLATDKLKDTSLDFRTTQDYREARAAMLAELAVAAPLTLNERFEVFLQARGLPHPGDVLQGIRDYANEFLNRARDPSASERISVDSRINTVIAERHKQVRGLEPDEQLRQPLARLDHVQQHSAAMNHEGLARRSAFHTAENEMTHMRTAEALRTYAERVADVVSPTVVVSIGRTLHDVHDEPRLVHLAEPVRDALQANWTSVHAVSRAAWELGLLETVRAFETGYSQERDERTTLADYESAVASAIAVPELDRSSSPLVVDPPIPGNPVHGRASDALIVVEPEPAKPFLHAVERWSQTVEDAAAHAVHSHFDFASVMQNVERYAAIVWRDPQAALAKLNDVFARQPLDTAAFVAELQKSPQTYGDLQGARTLMLKPDANRQAALSHVRVFGNTYVEAHITRARIEPVLRQEEARWRQEMSTSMPALSKEATAVVNELVRASEMKRPDREPAQQIAMRALSQHDALNEVRTWRQSLNARLKVPNAVERIPGLSKAQKVEVQATIARVDTALREVEMTRAIEHSRQRSLERSMNRERDRGGYER